MAENKHRRLSREATLLTPAERMERFYRLQIQAFAMMSPEGRKRFERRNRRIRRTHWDGSADRGNL